MRSQAVALLQVEPSPLFFTWGGVIVVTRTQRGVFRLFVRKSAEGLNVRSGSRWATLADVKQVKTSQQFVAGITRCEDVLHVKIGWDAALEKLALLDWPFSVAVAQCISYPVPQLPPFEALLSQPHLDRLGKVTVSVKWGYEVYELAVKIAEWICICSGKKAHFKLKYWYEGEQFNSYWKFAPSNEYSLVVDGDDGAERFTGSIEDAWVTGPLISGLDLGKLIRETYLMSTFD